MLGAVATNIVPASYLTYLLPQSTIYRPANSHALRVRLTHLRLVSAYNCYTHA